MVKAGPAVDEFIEKLMPLLAAGRRDHRRRQHPLQRHRAADEVRGIQGPAVRRHGRLRRRGRGAEGPEHDARRKPPAWPLVKPIFQAIAAKVGPSRDIPCCEWVGPRGAGHYVKMVHNGIEYGDMQLICEAYWMLKQALGLTNDELYEVFARWHQGELNSYLIEITRDIFSVKDPETGRLPGGPGPRHGRGQGDGQVDEPIGVGPGRAQHAGDRGGLRPLAFGDEGRPGAGEPVLRRPAAKFRGTAGSSSSRSARPFMPRRFAATPRASCSFRRRPRNTMALEFGSIALLWRGGCIIRAVFLERIKEAFDADPGRKTCS